MHTVDEVLERVRVDFRIGVDLPLAHLATIRYENSPSGKPQSSQG